MALITRRELQRAADSFAAAAGSDPELAPIASRLRALLEGMDSPGQRAVRSIKIEIDFGSKDDQVIDAQPNHAGQIPSTHAAGE